MNLIKCPHCGAEYLPEEIFCPENFKTSVSNIIKDDGKLLHHSGKSLAEEDIIENYICDKCSHSFKVKASLSFSSEKDEFEEDVIINIW